MTQHKLLYRSIPQYLYLHGTVRIGVLILVNLPSWLYSVKATLAVPTKIGTVKTPKLAIPTETGTVKAPKLATPTKTGTGQIGSRRQLAGGASWGCSGGAQRPCGDHLHLIQVKFHGNPLF